MTAILFKALGIWILLAVLAIINGLLRESLLVRLLGQDMALPVSGIIFSLAIFLVSLFVIPFIRKLNYVHYLAIGLFWVSLILIFEFTFGHFIVGKSWQEIVQVFNIMKGDLFLLVLVISFVSPWLAAKVRGMI